MKKKTFFWILTFYMLFAMQLHGQSMLIYPKPVLDISERSKGILQQSKAFHSVFFVNIDLEQIFEDQQFSIEFGGDTVLIHKEQLHVRGIHDFCFIGTGSGQYSVLISVLGQNIQGVIETNQGIYAIETLGNDDYVIIEIDQSQLNDCGGILSDSDQDDEEQEEQPSDTNFIENPDPGFDTLGYPDATLLQSTIMRECKIRVLVLYTPYAQQRTSNIKNTVLTAIELANLSFARSGIYYKVELAYLGLTDYNEIEDTEGDFKKSLRRYKKSGDEYMNEVHVLRERYSADVCVLLLGNSSLCGLASGIGVGEKKAFCAVSTYSTCATANYSFIHEIGHLLGCRHDMKADANIVPYAYAHGYFNPAKTWRTIMAYASSCNGCQRIGYWSNPGIYYNNDAMGTTNRHYNARVWNMYAEDFMAYRQPGNDAIYWENDSQNASYVDILAKQNIITLGNIHLPSGGSLQMSAGNGIILSPGFHADRGSDFIANIKTINDCGDAKNSPKISIQNIPYEETGIENMILPEEKELDFTCEIFPNPSDEWINIRYSLHNEKPLSITLVNFLGQKVQTVLSGEYQDKGFHELKIPVSGFTPGTYFLILSSPHQSETKKIILIP